MPIQEVILAAPQGRAAKGREAAESVGSRERDGAERGRKEDFGSVIEAGDRKDAEKNAAARPVAKDVETIAIAEPDARVVDAETENDGSAADAFEGAANTEEVAPDITFAGDMTQDVEDAEYVPPVVAEEEAQSDDDETVAPEIVAVPVPEAGRDATFPATPTAASGVSKAPAPTPGPKPLAAERTQDDPEAPADVGASEPETPLPPRPSAAPAVVAAAPDLRVGAPAPSPSAAFSLDPQAGDIDWRLSPRVDADSRAALRIPPQAVTGQIAVAVARSSGNRVEVRLDPPELGRVQIQLNPTERGLHVVVMSERPETGDFLRRHVETLTRDLEQSGYDNVTLEFSAGGSDTPRGRDPVPLEATLGPTSVENGSAGADAGGAPEIPAAARAVAAGTLDIRL